MGGVKSVLGCGGSEGRFGNVKKCRGRCGRVGEHGAKSHKGKLSQAQIQHNQRRELFTDVITSGHSTFDKIRWLAILFSAAELRKKASLNFTLL